MTSNETYDAIVNAGIAKCCMDKDTLGARSMLAGMFIAIGCMMMLLVKSDSSLSPAVSAILSGICFSAGLFSIFVCESELFTGDCLMIFGLIEEKYGISDMIRTLLLVLAHNISGAVFIAAFFMGCGMQNTFREAILAITEAKMAMGMHELVARSILCNFLVCLGAWINAKSTSVTEKMLAAAIPVTIFVSLGFEHSIANAFLYILMNTDPIWDLTRRLASIFGNLVGGILLFGTVQCASFVKTAKYGAKEVKNG